MSLYLLDTNIVSYLAGGNATTQEKVMDLNDIGRVCISAITEAEIRYGLAKRPVAKEKRAAIDFYLRLFAVLPWTSAAAKTYGELKARNERKGLTVSGFDMLIAAHAKAERALLVTSDGALAKLEGVDVLRW